MKKWGEMAEKGVSIDVIGSVHNILSRLPSSCFAYAACVNRFWNHLCDSVLSIPKLASAHSRNPSLHKEVEEVFNKVFSELIRPHFAIVTVTSPDLHLARQLITEKLGSTISIIYTTSLGLIGRDAVTNEFKEMSHVQIQWEVHSGKEEPHAYFFDEDDDPQPEAPSEDEILTDIRGCVTSVSGSTSSVGIMLFTDNMTDTYKLLEKLDHAMSLETFIIGDGNDMFLCGGDFTNKIYERMNEHTGIAAVVLLFMCDQKKSSGTVNIQFYVALSADLSPVSETYKVTYVKEKHCGLTSRKTKLTARREEFVENLNGQTSSTHIYDDI